MKYLVYSIFLVGIFSMESCKCKLDPATCAELSSDELLFIEKMSGVSLNLKDSASNILFLDFNNIESNVEQDEYASKMDDCTFNCVSNKTVKGKVSGYYYNVDFNIGLTYSTTNKNSDIEKLFVIKVGTERFESIHFPFHKHNRATYYKTFEFAGVNYKDVYKIPLSTSKSTDPSLVFQIGDIYLTEKDGIIGLNNQIDSLMFFRVL